MNTTLHKLGVDLNKTDFFITHLHVDHMGLVGTLASDNATVYFNEREAQLIYAQSAGDNYWEKMLDLYIANGFAAEMRGRPWKGTRHINTARNED